MPINVSEAICSDTAEKITVERTSGGSYIDGIYSKGTTTIIKMIASVQQPTAQQLQILPQNERNGDLRLFISKKKLRGTSNRDKIAPDVVIYKGIRFKILSPADWDSYGYTAAIGARVE